jgi:2-amino-4-hydroxy-6-hydroxymethyldihydropteridine diphosphokinase
VHTAYLSLGSNLGDRAANIARALQLLPERGVRILRTSSLWETAPQDFERQPWFLNMVAEAETALFPRQLLHEAQRVEKELGRRRIRPKGPRTIDIDILLFGNFVMSADELEIPHPRLAQRRFVLAPLAELAPDLKHPLTRATVREMLAEVKEQPARRVGA